MAAPAVQYAKDRDLHIAYQVWGEGPVDLVLVWGTFSHCELFWEDPPMARFLTELGRFARVVQFDKRGTGMSDAMDGIPTLEERMDDVRIVMDAVGIERAALFGESEGCSAAGSSPQGSRRRCGPRGSTGWSTRGARARWPPWLCPVARGRCSRWSWGPASSASP
jgi:hypothetical protein